MNLLRLFVVRCGGNDVDTSGRFGWIERELACDAFFQLHDNLVAVNDPACLLCRVPRLATNSPGTNGPGALQPFLVSALRFLDHRRSGVRPGVHVGAFVLPGRGPLRKQSVAQDDALFDDLVFETGQVDLGDDSEGAVQFAGRSPRARA